MTKQATISTERELLIHGIFTTAVESGIDYWFDTDYYHWRKPVSDDTPFNESLDLFGFEARGTEYDTETRYTINSDVIKRGVSRAHNRQIEIGRIIRSAILLADCLNDASDIDAECADVIVQLGLFGKIIYG